MFDMTIEIKLFGITIAIIGRQLKTVEVFNIIKCLVTIEMLQVGNTNGITV